MNFIRRLYRENFYVSSQRCQRSHDKIQNFSSISLKLCVLDQKYTGTSDVNTTITDTWPRLTQKNEFTAPTPNPQEHKSLCN